MLDVTATVTSEVTDADVATTDHAGAIGHVQHVHQRAARTASTPVQATTQAGASNQILAANVERAGFILTNEAAVPLYVRYGGAASSVLFSFVMAPGERVSAPGDVPLCDDAIEARLASGSDSTAMAQELTW